MNATEAIKILTDANKWRRGDESIPHPNPIKFGEAIDYAIETIKLHNICTCPDPFPCLGWDEDYCLKCSGVLP